MAFYYPEPSHTFSEYLLVPGFTSEECIPDNVSLKTPLVKYRKGEEDCPISLNIPMVSAIMQAVSNDTLAVALAKEGGLSFIYGSQSIEDEAAMVRRVKSSKAGFVISASNLTPDATLADVLALKEKNGFSTVAITEDATPTGKLLGAGDQPGLPNHADEHGHSRPGVYDPPGKAHYGACGHHAERGQRHHLGQ